MRDHGGDLDRAKATYGGCDWIDLSTGINRLAYTIPDLPLHAWTALPTTEDIAKLETTAARAYGTTGPVVALAGAQAAIQLVPRLDAPGRAAVLAPSYNEHAAALTTQGWQVDAASDLDAMVGADLAVVVNPNNPDGQRWSPTVLIDLAGKVGRLVVDESFADAETGLSLAPYLMDLGENVIVMRSFGKFFGLAGVRLGFVLAGPKTAARIRALAGPWAVGGPAIAIGTTALADQAWHRAMTIQLGADAARLSGLLDVNAGWRTVGASALFVTVEAGDALQAQARLARARIWTRAFPYSSGWLRLGLPGPSHEWTRLEAALTGND